MLFSSETFFTDSKRYEGFWRDSLQHGLGYLHQAGGSSRLALWAQGKRTRWISETVRFLKSKNSERPTIALSGDM